MYTIKQLNLTIAKAAEIAGSQRKLAAILEMEHANLVKIKKGERPANWRVRGKLRAILGEDPAQAFMAAMAEDLEQSENQDEKKAAESFKAILATFPSTGGNGWFRMLNLVTLDVFRGLRSAVDGTLSRRLRDTILNRQAPISDQPGQILSY